jgi:HD-GYP domain-containing protein (c-di-GMP phosphodiesterase class II)
MAAVKKSKRSSQKDPVWSGRLKLAEPRESDQRPVAVAEWRAAGKGESPSRCGAKEASPVLPIDGGPSPAGVGLAVFHSCMPQVVSRGMAKTGSVKVMSRGGRAGKPTAERQPECGFTAEEPLVEGNLALDLDGLSGRKDCLLDELEKAYEGLAQALEISRREADVAYAELKKKISVLERKVFELISVNNIGKAITSELKLDTLLEVVLAKICELIEVDSAVLALANEREELEIKLVRGLPKTHVGRVFALDLEVAYRAALSNNEPVLIPDLDCSRRLSVFKLDPRMVSAVVIPLKTHKEKVGLLVLNSTERHSFNQEHVLLLSTFGAQAAIAIVNAKLYANLKRMLVGVVVSLSTALEAKDPYTEGHSTRVAEYAVAIGRKIGLGAEALEEIENAGLIHDIGKIGVPESVICKKGKLDPDEWEQMRKHPKYGENIASPVPFLASVVPGVKSHHERFDGKGYPDGLAREKIPLMARILAVADTFDAITSKRPYRGPRSPEEALEEIRAHSGTQFDPRIVRALEEAFEEIVETAGERFTTSSEKAIDDTPRLSEAGVGAGGS